MIPEAKLGWMAGIVDFQGHVVRKNNKMRASGSQQITLYVETKTAEIITRLGEMTGLSPEYMKKPSTRSELMRRGCTEHCPDAHIHANETLLLMPAVHRWAVSGSSMAVILWNLREHMVTADEPWDWALAQTLACTRLSGQGSGAVVRALNRLHELGWELPPMMSGAVALEAAS